MSASIRFLVVLLVFVSACVTVRRAPESEMSGFLDDYSLLQPAEYGQLYLNSGARWTQYDEVLLEPVTLWRSGRRSLAPVPEAELMRLVSTFQAAVRRRLGEGFTMVEQPGPGVLRIRLAITQAHASDPVLDVLTAQGGNVPGGEPVLHAELRRFIDSAAIEGEIRDATTNELLAQAVERRRHDAPPLATWADIVRALDAWTTRVGGRLEARTHPRAQ